MLFNSYEFIFMFLPVMFVVYFYLMSKRVVLGAKIWLVAGSLFFYSYWNITYLPLILISMFTNYGVGLTLVNQDRVKISSKTVLAFGIFFNLALLGYFKYTDFFLENFNGIFGSNIPLPHIILPLGISFFTFTQIAFLVDAYKKEAKEYNIFNYMLFVTYFPHLLAGPILHHKEMMPQFASVKNYAKNYKNIALGLFIFSIGLFKKVIIADTFAVWANAGFDTATTLNLIEAWATSLSYTFQLYFDFSGYTDMAIGVSLMFNIKLPINFNSPYKALSIQDFWRRWHITLSRFLRDYLYIPLGGNRKGEIRTYTNLITTFLLGGFWHGAGWTFIIWGLLHGIALAIHRMWQSFGFKLNKILAWFITFNFINITWIFFRAKDFESAIKVLGSMFSLDNVVLPEKYFKFLAQYNEVYFKFGEVYTNILGKDNTTVFVILGFILVLGFKNSM
ncbi:MBOAT family protein, partial [Aliarcobacter cryaerophilus]|uniref:MBOAT family O-acyltransferase n=1 Tax=Aliarcobacter cryaerophilus TaxID=28198 RepID=UPI003DA5DAA1